MVRVSKSFACLLATASILGVRGARADAPGCTAAGALPQSFPQQLLMGISSSTPDDTWAKDSGTKWNVQWMYLSGQSGNNWYNTWGYGTADGSWIGGAMKTIGDRGFIPGIHLYNMGYGHDQGDAGLLTEIQDATWSKKYFTEFKALMQQAKTYGKPVLIVLEGDSFGMIEMLAKNDPTTKAAVASTGLSELASLPDTIAGFGMAYLALRKSVGAYNVAMGPDTPYYAANGDIMNYAPSDAEDLGPHVEYQWKFFGSFVGANATGDRFDFTASCPSAADCKYYTDGRPCWDPSDSASVNSPSINRYLDWLHRFNQTSGVRWVLHQVPIGNSQHRNVAYDGSARSGYQDNKVEYLFQYESPASEAIRDQHLANFVNAGVIALLFGNSDDGDTPSTDLWTDGQPFLKTHVAAVNNSEGFAICGSTDGGASSGAGGTSSVGAGGGASSVGAGGGASSVGAGGAVVIGIGGAGGSSGGTNVATGSGGAQSFGAAGAAAAGTTAAAAASSGDSNGGGCSVSRERVPRETSSAAALGLLVALASLGRRRQRA